tara:strand:+ start:4572 stop:5345 length:774 start_codon:yes stop_codon:yes gene_type:complete
MNKNIKKDKNLTLLGDIGNTDIKICVLKSNYKIVKRLIIKNNLKNKNYLPKNLEIVNKFKGRIKKILFSSVVPNSFKIIKFILEKKFKIKCYEIKSINIKNILNLKVNKKQIGSDRIANAIGVSKKNKNFIVIDFGTATTLDVIINKTYLGGVIAPGVKLSLETLIERATLIPKINLSKIKKVVGNNTESAVKSGFYWGYSGLIDNMIKLIIKQTRKSFHVVLTGGLANLYKNSLYKKVTVDKDLTIKGLIKILKFI